jgi:hypothetical protein
MEIVQSDECGADLGIHTDARNGVSTHEILQISGTTRLARAEDP